MNPILLYSLAFVLYASLIIHTWRPTQRGGERAALEKNSPRSQFASQLYSQAWLGAALLVHAVLLHSQIFTPQGLRFGFATALSVTLWLGTLLYWAESWQFALQGMRLVLFPLAALALGLPALFPGGVSQAALLNNPWFKVHIVIALAAYGLFTIAALHALMMLVLARTLHDKSNLHPWLQKMATGLPALMTLEKLLFRMLGAGFALLTLTLLTGVVFSEALFGQAVKVDHKTIFSLLAWLVFAVLLVGRYVAGWRGRLALRYTLAGFALLLLSYIGSRFVLEVILQRVM